MPDAGDLPPELDGEDLVAVGADLEPGTLLAAYTRGLFPMGVTQRTARGLGRTRDVLGWWSPDPRGVLPLRGLVVSRSLRASRRRFVVTVDAAFGDVVAGCATADRDGAWITGEFVTAYRRLHELGWAHSVEVWDDTTLVGGLYGVAVGGLFAGESMFHRSRDASKVALAGLVSLLSRDGADRLLDVQWRTPHLARLGAVEVPRRRYRDLLDQALGLPLPEELATPHPGFVIEP
ncbi:MAG: leucyl/phenylalanyl-tRNA--protein transferase [Actinomycetes bacterium]